ncbi:hypothetical protein [Vreelandella maris]|uniref:hypothetical protein n=1 Tax=Vreelandella maris TaxID=2729617 RepID=UPI0030EC191B
MNIDHHTINTLRTLANQCAELEHHAGLEPANLLALLDAFEERDALAAHVELITRTARFLLQGLADDDQWRPNSSTSQIFNALIHDLDKGPATSLVRRDLMQHAEALEEAAGETVPAMHQMANWLRARAADKRQQAEGHQ